MNFVVGRASEIRRLEDAFALLLNPIHARRPPMMNISGMRGVGKTALLRRVEQWCQHRPEVTSIWVDVNLGANALSQTILHVAKTFGEERLLLNHEEDMSVSLAVDAITSFTKQKPLVLLLDSVETSNTEEVRWLEAFLCDLVNENRLLVIFASRDAVIFSEERSIARTIVYLPLSTLDWPSCRRYFRTLGKQIPLEIEALLFAWTSGLPLAMNILAEAIQGGLDPQSVADQHHLLNLLSEQVIEEGALATISTEIQRDAFRRALRVLSVPRNFHLIVFQDLMELFVPLFKREKKLSYLRVFKDLQDMTHVMRWKTTQGGFVVEAPIRQLFLHLLRRDDPVTYVALHTFLAETHLFLAKNAGGPSRVRSLREYLYHIACVEPTPAIATHVTEALEHLSHEPVELLTLFSKEFCADQELEELLGNQKARVHSLLHKQLNRFHMNVSLERKDE